MDQFNLDITSNDFNVEPIVIGDDFAIFAGIRPLFFHFVVIQNEVSDGFKYTSNYQFHLHKFDVANEFLELKNQGKNNNNKEWIRNKERDTLQLSLDPEMKYWMALDFLGFEVGIEPETGQWFLDELENESKRVEAAINYLSMVENQVALLRKLRLPAKGEYDFTKTVWRCIQFEQDLFATFKRKPKGIAGLYPKLLKGKTELSESDVSRVAEGLDRFDPLCTCEFCTKNAYMFDAVQEEYFPQRIYIRDKKKLSFRKIQESTKIMCDKLDPIDRISLTYLFDYSPMALVTLSYLGGFRTEQSIISLVCGGLQPDSKEEQAVREQISLISWFRKIAGNE
jgi:hypothetical protein